MSKMDTKDTNASVRGILEDGKTISYAEYWRRFRDMPSGCSRSECTLSHSRGPHRGVWARPLGRRRLMRVDAGLGSLLQSLWHQGVQTYASCENNQNGYVWVGLSRKGASRFLDGVMHGNIGDNRFMRRLMSHRGEPCAWRYLCRKGMIPGRGTLTRAGLGWWRSSRCTGKRTKCFVDIRFPHDDLNRVINAFADVNV